MRGSQIPFQKQAVPLLCGPFRYQIPFIEQGQGILSAQSSGMITLPHSRGDAQRLQMRSRMMQLYYRCDLSLTITRTL